MYKTPGGTKYQLAGHALQRMAQRRIDRRAVEHVIDHFDTSHPDKKGNTCLIGQLGDGRRLRVVIDTAHNPVKVVTVIILG